MADQVNSTLTESQTSYVYSNVGSGLETWNQLAKSIRKGSRGGADYPPFSNSSIIDPTKLQSYYMGAGIIMAILFLAFLFTLFGSIFQCVRLCFCKKSLRRKHDKMKSKRPPSFKGKICAAIWILLITTFYLVGALTSYTGGAVFGGGVIGIGNAGVTVLNSTDTLVTLIVPLTSDWFTTLKNSVLNGIDQSSSYVNGQNLITYNVTTSLTALSNNMALAGQRIQGAIDSANAASAARSSAANLSTTIDTEVISIMNAVAAWSPSITMTGGSSYAINPTTVTTPSPNPTVLSTTIRITMSNAPQGSSFTTSLLVIPTACDVIAKQVKNASDTMPSMVNAKVVAQGTSVKTDVKTQLETQQNSIIGSLSSMRDGASSSISSGTKYLNDFISQAKTYNDYRNTAMMILSSLIILIVLVFYYFLFRRKPKSIKGCNLIASPIYVLIQNTAVLVFLLALIFGDLCSSIFEFSPPPILQGLDSATGTGVKNLIALRDQCSSGTSILNIAVNLDLVKSDDINTTTLLNKVIDVVDFSPLGGIDLSSLIVFNPDPATILGNLNNFTATIDTAGLSNAVATDLPAFKTSLTMFRNSLSVFNPTINPTSAAATSDFATRKAALVARLDALIDTGGSIDQLSGFASSTITSLNEIQPKANSAKIPATQAPIDYNNTRSNMRLFQTAASTDLLNAIPIIKSKIKSDIAQASDVLFSSLNCTGIGAGVFELQNQMCGQFLGGLDTLWLAYATIAVFSALSMPVLIWLANRLCYNTNEYVGVLDLPPPNGGYNSKKISPVGAPQKQSILKSFPAPASPSR